LQRVIEVSKQYIPYMSVGFDSPKIVQHIQDGAEFARQNEGKFDVVITDSSDPIGIQEAARLLC
jgi:spermidine synthase